MLTGVATFEERIYELGAEALAEQERQVAELRARGATLLAAAAVIASLLAKPVSQGDHPEGIAEVAAATVGLLGAGGVLVFAVLLLRPYELGFSVKPGATYRALWEQGILAQPMWTSRSPMPLRSAAPATARSSSGWSRCSRWRSRRSSSRPLVWQQRLR